MDYNDPILQKSIEEFDLIGFLEDNNIYYKTDTKNVGEGWIGIEECPWCAKSNFHFAIHRRDKTTNCWNCTQAKGTLPKFVGKILQISYDDACRFIMEELDAEETDADLEFQINNIFNSKRKPDEIRKEKPVNLPSNIKITRSIIEKNTVIKNFLKEKRVHYEDCIEDNLRIGLEEHKNKIILPIYYENKLVAFQERHILFKMYHNEGYVHDYLYKLDLIPKSSTIILVEGYYDYVPTRRFLLNYRKEYFVTTGFFKRLTDNQIDLLQSKKPKQVIFFLDKDAWFEYEALADNLVCPTTFLIPNKKDPGLMLIHDFLKVFKGSGL